jgi:hypothetical protein
LLLEFLKERIFSGQILLLWWDRINNHIHLLGLEYAAALGIEILCIAAAEIGENTALYLFGFNPSGIAIAYILGYALAGFTTFATILGRYV